MRYRSTRTDPTPVSLSTAITRGLAPDKTNWALPIDQPPFEAYVTTTGVTFTFGFILATHRSV